MSFTLKICTSFLQSPEFHPLAKVSAILNILLNYLKNLEIFPKNPFLVFISEM